MLLFVRCCTVVRKPAMASKQLGLQPLPGAADFSDIHVDLADYIPAAKLSAMGSLEKRAYSNKIENYLVLKKLGMLVMQPLFGIL